MKRYRLTLEHRGPAAYFAQLFVGGQSIGDANAHRPSLAVRAVVEQARGLRRRGGLPSEEWKSIPSAPGYEASSLGRIRCWRPRNRQARAPSSPRIVRATQDSHGYYGVSISIDGRASRRKVHALVLEAFKGPRPPGLQARHVVERDTSNNTPGNLEWGTAKENQADRRRHAMQQRRSA